MKDSLIYLSLPEISLCVNILQILLDTLNILVHATFLEQGCYMLEYILKLNIKFVIDLHLLAFG